MDEPFDAGLEFDESAVVGDVGDRALDLAADRILGLDAFPRIGLSSCFMPRLMRCVSGLMRTICTFTVWPTYRISVG